MVSPFTPPHSHPIYPPGGGIAPLATDARHPGRSDCDLKGYLLQTANRPTDKRTAEPPGTPPSVPPPFRREPPRDGREFGRVRRPDGCRRPGQGRNRGDPE